MDIHKSIMSEAKRTALDRLHVLRDKVNRSPKLWETLSLPDQVQLHALTKFEAHREYVLENHLHSIGAAEIDARAYSEDDALFGDSDSHGDRHQQTSFPLLPELLREINGINGHSSFVVLGDSGSGKSTLAIRLCQEFWDHFDEWARIPIYIFLPEYKSVDQLLKRFFGNRLDDRGLDEASKLSFLLVLDSFDELPDDEKYRNIASAQLPPTGGVDGGTAAVVQFQDVKIVTLTRRQGLNSEKRKAIFDMSKTGNMVSECSEGHIAYFLAPFTPDDIKFYVKKFVEKLSTVRMDPDINSALQMVKKHTQDRTWEAWAEDDDDKGVPNTNAFLRWFAVLPDLFQLSSTPLLLSLIMAVMPEMLNPLDESPNNPTRARRLSELRRLCRTRTGIYDLFTDNWFRFQSERLEYSESHPDLVRGVTTEERLLLFRFYSQNLAHWFLHAGTFKNSLHLSETEHWSLLDPYQGNIQLREACQRITATSEMTGFPVRCVGPLKTVFEFRPSVRDVFPSWASHDEEASVRDRKLRNLRAIRDGCLLQFSATECKFVHRSLVIYFESRQLSETMELLFQLYLRNELRAIDGQTSELLFTQQLTNTDILSELAARVRLRENFDKVLLEIVCASRTLPSLSTFASNAVTILNLGGRSLSGLDLSRVLIPRANLSHAIIAGTDLRGANLEGAFLESALLSRTQLQGANMRGVEFGQAPSCAFRRVPSEQLEVRSYFSTKDNRDFWIVIGATTYALGTQMTSVTKYEMDWSPASTNFRFQLPSENFEYLSTHIGSRHVFVAYEKLEAVHLEGWSIENPTKHIYARLPPEVGSPLRVAEDKGLVALVDGSRLWLWQVQERPDTHTRTLVFLGSTKLVSTKNHFSHNPEMGEHTSFDFRRANAGDERANGQGERSCMAIVCTSVSSTEPECILAAYWFDISTCGKNQLRQNSVSVNATKLFDDQISCIRICTLGFSQSLVAIAFENQDSESNLELWRFNIKADGKIMTLKRVDTMGGHQDGVVGLACNTLADLLASACRVLLILRKLQPLPALKLRVIRLTPSPFNLGDIFTTVFFGNNSLAFSHDSKYLAFVNQNDGQLKVWKLSARVPNNVADLRPTTINNPATIQLMAVWVAEAHPAPSLIAVICQTIETAYTATQKLGVLEVESGKVVGELQLRTFNKGKYIALEFLNQNTILACYTEATKLKRSPARTYLQALCLNVASCSDSDSSTIAQLRLDEYNCDKDWDNMNVRIRLGRPTIRGAAHGKVWGKVAMEVSENTSGRRCPNTHIWSFKVKTLSDDGLQLELDSASQKLNNFPTPTLVYNFALHGDWLAYSVDTYGGVWDLSNCTYKEVMRDEAMQRKDLVFVGGENGRETQLLAWDKNQLQIRTINEIDLKEKAGATFQEMLSRNSSIGGTIHVRWGSSSRQTVLFADERSVTLTSQETEAEVPTTLLKISLWFKLKWSRFVHSMDRNGSIDGFNNVGYLVLGSHNLDSLCTLQINYKGNSSDAKFLDPHSWSWKILWSRSKCNDLIADSANVTKALLTDKVALTLLRQEGSLGVDDVLQDPRWRFNSYASLFTEITGTSLNPELSRDTILKVRDCSLLIDEASWAVFAVAELQGGFLRRVFGFIKTHVFLIVEGVLNNRRFLIYADYVMGAGGRHVPGVRVYPLCEASSAAEEWAKFENYSEKTGGWQAQVFCVSREQGLALIDTIYEDRQRLFVYGALANDRSKTTSCTKWTHGKLAGIGCNLTTSWVNKVCYPPTQLAIGHHPNVFVRWTHILRNLAEEHILALWNLIANFCAFFVVLARVSHESHFCLTQTH